MKNIFKVILILLCCMPVLRSTAKTQEQKSADVLMGMAIQKYLEGDLAQAIDFLDQILTREPDHKRAHDLLEKASERYAEHVKASKSYESGIGYLEKAGKHLPDFQPLQSSIREFREILGQSEVETETPAAEVKEEPAAVKKKTVKAEPAAAAKKTVSSGESEKKIRQLNSYIRKLENRLSGTGDANKQLASQLRELKEERNKLMANIRELQNVKPPSGLPPLALAGLILAGAIATGFIYFSFKTELSGVLKNMINERQAVEDLKNSYNKDTEKLAKQLAEYGKSYQRAEELEKNWAKIIDVVERLSRGGSTKKLVLKDSPDGRKAVTGVDPRTRARADSVEVIAEIFKDSPKAPDMLKPFLDDPDNRTRANAAVAYYRYDPEKSMAILQEMSNSPDKWMRLSSAWALGEIADPVMSSVLEKLLDDPDSDVKNKARISLEKILKNGGGHRQEA